MRIERTRIRRAIRRLAVVVSGLLVLGGLALVVYLHTVGPDANLDFLQGRPTVESTVAGFSSESRSSSNELRIYAWKEPVAKVSALAEGELRAKGFHLLRRKGDWTEWRRGGWIVDFEASRPTGRPILYHQRQNRAFTTVTVGREVEDDLWFHIRLLFSPYGITQS